MEKAGEGEPWALPAGGCPGQGLSEWVRVLGEGDCGWERM